MNRVAILCAGVTGAFLLCAPASAQGQETDAWSASSLDGDGAAQSAPELGDGTRASRPLKVFVLSSLSRTEYPAFEANWISIGGGVAVPVKQDHTLTVSLENQDRGARSNTRGELRFTTAVEGALFYVAAAASRGASFRERFSASSGGEANLGSTVAVTLDGRYAVYRDDTASDSKASISLNPGVRVSPVGSGLELRAQWINLWDVEGVRRQGLSGRAAYYLGDADFIFGGYATYPDTEQLVTRQIDAFHAGLRFDVDSNFALRLTAEHLKREESYTQNAVHLGIELAL